MVDSGVEPVIQSAVAVQGGVTGSSPLLNLSHCISQARSRLKELKQSIPSASSDAAAPLMGRLQTIAPDDSAARIELIEALGRTRDPVVLRALLLVAGAGSKHVRRAVAVALSGINHTLSAYILLPMLEDQSSRVRNSAIQALIYINQPHTSESIISACVGNRELKRIAFDTVLRLRPVQREEFIHRLSLVNPAGSGAASDLVREFRSVANSLPSAAPASSLERASQPARPPQEIGNADVRPSGQAHASASVTPPSVSRIVQENSRTPERPGFEPAVTSAEVVQQLDRERAVTDLVATADQDSVRKYKTDSQFEIPIPSAHQDGSTVRANDETVSRSQIPRPLEGEAIQAPRHMNGGSVAELRRSEAPAARISHKSDDFVNHGIDVSTLDDLAVSRLMSELVPETPGVRSSDSVADFRFFESLSTNLNDSRGDWQSPENSVFDYDPAPEFSFSDTQSFSQQNTNTSDFAFSSQPVPSISGSSASGRVPRTNTAGSSASWNMQPPAPAFGDSTPTSPSMNPGLGGQSRSGSHVFHPPESMLAPPVGSAWPSVPQNPIAGALPPGSQGMSGGMQQPYAGYQPPHSMPMHPHFAMPPAAYPLPPMAAPVFPPMGTDPSIPLMSRSAEFATFNPTNQPSSSAGSNAVQPQTENAGPLSEEVLLNGGTMLEIPMMQAAGTTVATSDAQSSAPVELTVNTTVSSVEAEKAALKAQGERNLERLRLARDQAFRVLLENQEAITGAAPRLISKKITTLLTTPAGDHAQIKQQLVALGKTGSPHVLETLASFCQKPVKEIRISCAEALGLVKHQGSVVQLLKFLGDKSGTVIETALKSMISLQDKAVYPVILAAGLVNSSLRTIVSSSIETLAEEFKPAWEQQLLSCLALNDPDLMAFSIQLLVKLTGATHVDSFLSFAENGEPVIRAAAIDALVRTGAKKVIGTINAALEDADPLVRAQAASAAATMHSPRSIDLLGKLLLDSSLSVRRSAAQSVARIEEPDLGDAIVAALKVETDHLVIEYLLEALNKNGGNNAYSLLVQFVEGTDTELRELALKALRKLKLQESVPVFTRLLDDKHPHIRKQAIEQLALLKSSGAISRLKQMVKADTDEHVRGACARALGDLQDKTSLDLLEAALEDHAVVRFQAVLALGKIGNTAAGPSLLALLRDSQPEIRYQAVRALGQLKLEGSEVHLEPLLQDSDVMVRRGVEQTLQEFGMSPGQIRRLRFQKTFTKAMLAISPSYIFAALPGKAGSAVAVLTMILAFGGVWLASNFGSFVSGSSSLPVLSVENVRISSAADLAVVWRKQAVLDVLQASSGKLNARIGAPTGTRDVLIENKGGVLALADKSLFRLRAEDDFDPELAKSKEFAETPWATCFHSKDNLVCVFLPGGSGTRLELLNAETLETTATHEIKARFDGRCLVSSDRKMALSIANDAAVSVADLGSGQVVKVDVGRLVKGGNPGLINAAQISQDMKYVCFCTTSKLLVFALGKMTLEKQIDDRSGFIGVVSSNDGLIAAITPDGRIFRISKDLASVTQEKMENYFDVFNLDPGGKQIIFANSEEYNAEVFDVQQNKVITTIVGE
jgi:HEAT repeat protein